MLPTKENFRNLGMNISGDSLFCYRVEENIDHLFITCDLAINLWCTVENYCTNPNNTNDSIICWIEYLWCNKTWYRKRFGKVIEKVLTILSAIWNNMNNIVFKNNNCNPNYFLELAKKNYHETVI